MKKNLIRCQACGHNFQVEKGQEFTTELCKTCSKLMSLNFATAIRLLKKLEAINGPYATLEETIEEITKVMKYSDSKFIPREIAII
jgi:transposase-like protein